MSNLCSVVFLKLRKFYIYNKNINLYYLLPYQDTSTLVHFSTLQEKKIVKIITKKYPVIELVSKSVCNIVNNLLTHSCFAIRLVVHSPLVIGYH